MGCYKKHRPEAVLRGLFPRKTFGGIDLFLFATGKEPDELAVGVVTEVSVFFAGRAMRFAG